MKAILYGFLSLLAAAISLEIIMSAAGIGYNFFQSRSLPKIESTSGTTNILCIGESTTAWGLSESYPAQLQLQLNNLYGQGKYNVINAGVAATDTSEILSRLESNLAEHKPQIVITMIGINDFWKMAAPSALDNLHLYKLYKIIAHNISILLNEGANTGSNSESKPALARPVSPAPQFKDLTLFNTAVSELEKGKNDVALKHFTEFAKQEDSADALAAVGQIYYEKYGVFHAASQKIARSFFNKALAKNPDNLISLKYLGCSYYNTAENKEQAKPLLERGYNLGSRDTALVASLADIYRDSKDFTAAEKVLLSAVGYEDSLVLWTRLIELKMLQNENAKAREYINEAFKAYPGNGAISNLKSNLDSIEGLPRETFYSVYNYLDFPPTQENYKKISQLLENRGIIHVAMTYPVRENKELKNILSPFNKIVFVEQKKNFDSALNSENFNTLFIDSFGGDFGHFTKKGSEMVASEIVNVLKAEKIIP